MSLTSYRTAPSRVNFIPGLARELCFFVLMRRCRFENLRTAPSRLHFFILRRRWKRSFLRLTAHSGRGRNGPVVVLPQSLVLCRIIEMLTQSGFSSSGAGGSGASLGLKQSLKQALKQQTRPDMYWDGVCWS